MTKKYLAPNGKSYTESQLDRLNMKTVFDFLVDLNVADSSMYNDYKKEQRAPIQKDRIRYIYKTVPQRPFRVIYRPKSIFNRSPQKQLQRNPVMYQTAPRILPTNPMGNRCERMGLVMCPDNQCATSYATCNM